MRFLAILFAIIATAGVALGCFTVTTDPDGAGGTISPITSGGQYLPNQNCGYTISQFGPYGLTLWFTKMDLEVDDSWRPCESHFPTCTDECDKNDYVSISDSSTNQEVTRRCGQNIPNYTYRTNGPAYVYFKSDRSFQRTGFILNFRIDPDTEPCVGTTILPLASSGTITNYARAIDGNYRNNEDCKWKVTVPSNYDTIRFSFSRVEIDGTCSGSDATCTCPHDWISIYDGDTDSARVVTQRCGFSVPTTSFYTNESSTVAFVQFKTDASVQYKGFTLNYQGCNQPCETTSTSTTTTTTTPKPTIPWPREENLLGFWPLDRKNGLQDVSAWKHNCHHSCNGVTDNGEGPFGDESTSHHTRNDVDGILAVDSILDPANSYTVSMFVKVPLDGYGGLLSLYSTEQDFALDIENIKGRPFLRVRGGASANTDVYGPYDVIQPGTWTYIAAVFDAVTCSLSIHGQFGELYMPSYKSRLCQRKGATSQRSIRVGYNSLFENTNNYNLNSSVSVSCVMLYSTVLSPDEIGRNAEICRIPHESVPCGAPRIPLLSIPSESTTTPQYGQFPYLATLYFFSNHICGASILSRHYLLTAASCFSDSETPKDYEVRVADHNLDLFETYEQRHAVGKIWVHPNYNVSGNDVALVELATPIDLASFYVNTICLPEGQHSSEKGFFYGWGRNGRGSTTSASLPRYVTGTVESANTCTNSWGSAYNKDLTLCYQAIDSTKRNVPCTHDEGGPLLVAGNTTISHLEHLVPVGVYGRRYADNCENSAPALFTALRPYVNGIKLMMACNIAGYNYPDNCPINYA